MKAQQVNPTRTPHPGIILLIDALESKLDEKYCPRCETVMSRALDFGKDQTTPDGLLRYCKDCVRERRYKSARGY